MGISYLYIKYQIFSTKVNESLFKIKRVSLKTVKFLLFNIEYTNFANRLSNLIDVSTFKSMKSIKFYLILHKVQVKVKI